MYIYNYIHTWAIDHQNHAVFAPLRHLGRTRTVTCWFLEHGSAVKGLVHKKRGTRESAMNKGKIIGKYGKHKENHGKIETYVYRRQSVLVPYQLLINLRWYWMNLFFCWPTHFNCNRSFQVPHMKSMQLPDVFVQMFFQHVFQNLPPKSSCFPDLSEDFHQNHPWISWKSHISQMFASRVPRMFQDFP